MTAPTPIILCADDYGLSPAVSAGIRELGAIGRLSATSCMTTTPFWPDEAAKLKALHGQMAAGLHFTLTDHQSLGPMPHLAPDRRLPALGKLMTAALARRLEPSEIAAELDRQLDAFEAHFGAPPDYVDGHHHVHQLPIMRDVVLATLRRRLGGKAWLRVCEEPLSAILGRRIDPVRATVISLLGTGLQAAARRAGIACNRRFSGVYDLSGRQPYAQLMEGFLSGARPGLLVMCHPGHVDDHLRAVEQVTDQREVELAHLASDAFAAQLARHDLVLTRSPR